MTDDELGLISTGLSSDRVHGTWMGEIDMKRSDDLEDEIDAEIARRSSVTGDR